MDAAPALSQEEDLPQSRCLCPLYVVEGMAVVTVKGQLLIPPFVLTHPSDCGELKTACGRHRQPAGNVTPLYSSAHE